MKGKIPPKRTASALAAAFSLATMTLGSLALAQQAQPQQSPRDRGDGGREFQPPVDPQARQQQNGRSAREGAAIDLTGYWVAIVNEDWRWRMVTPPKGDYASVNIVMNEAARKVADTWDPASDGSCKAYGAAGLMRMPTRLHITWEGDGVLKIDTDAGQQTRRLSFDWSKPAAAQRSLQGDSFAEWQRPLPPPPGNNGAGLNAVPAERPGGSLRVVTTNLQPGWLRRNGVPYSENAVVTEYFDRFAVPNGGEWLVVTTIVEDRTYLNVPYITSSHFRREANGAGWRPQPCRAGV
jgi:hypothetical protein